MEETLKLKCQKCGVDYEKPARFIEDNKKYPNIFFRWSLAFCDKCRRDKEAKALEHLSKVVTVISNIDLE